MPQQRLRELMTMDPRTVVLVRTTLALLLLVDLASRLRILDDFYVDSGPLPREVVRLWQPTSLSFFFWFDSPGEVRLGFALCALVYVSLLVGFLTPLMQVLALYSIISLQARVHVLSMGGDFVVVLMCWWTLFMPLGRWGSVDATLMGRFRGARPLKPSDAAPFVSISVVGMAAQLAVIYLFNALHKEGVTWREGSAIHYSLWLDRVVTPLAVWLRGVLSETGSKALTWGTVAIEGILPLLILSPIGRPALRRVAMALILGLHVGIAALLHIGIFSLVMIAMATCLVSTADWEALSRLRGRLLCRFGVVPSAWGPSSTAEAPGAGGGAVASFLAAPRPRLTRFVSMGREGGALVFAIFIAATALQDNWAVPEWMRPPRPPWQDRLVASLRVHQGWHMFSPDVSRTETHLVVEAKSKTGKFLDPIALLSHQEGSRRVAQEVVGASGQNVFWHHYAQRVVDLPSLHGALREWLWRSHERTGRPEDEITRFRVYAVWRESPAPESDEPAKPEQRLILEGARTSGEATTETQGE
jgi:hypothetical protein